MIIPSQNQMLTYSVRRGSLINHWQIRWCVKSKPRLLSRYENAVTFSFDKQSFSIDRVICIHIDCATMSGHSSLRIQLSKWSQMR